MARVFRWIPLMPAIPGAALPVLSGALWTALRATAAQASAPAREGD